jgi:pimeloyl-ACP methyl ester carboxylesterase
MTDDPAPTRRVLIGPHALDGDLDVPAQARALVVFCHGSGSSRRSPRNRQVASTLNARGLATLLFDLLSPAEAEDRRLVFDDRLLADRVCEALDWIDARPALAALPVGLFGASTGAAAALRAAAMRPARVFAVVSRGGRPDLARDALPRVRAPTLLIVGSADEEVLALNRQALRTLRAGELAEVPGATHLFEEPGALEQVAAQAADWFAGHLPGAH